MRGGVAAEQSQKVQEGGVLTVEQEVVEDP